VLQALLAATPGPQRAPSPTAAQQPQQPHAPQPQQPPPAAPAAPVAPTTGIPALPEHLLGSAAPSEVVAARKLHADAEVRAARAAHHVLALTRRRFCAGAAFGARAVRGERVARQRRRRRGGAD